MSRISASSQALEYCLMSNFGSPENQEAFRARFVASNSRIKALGKTGVYTFATRMPKTSARLLGIPYDQLSDSYVGAGFESVVFRVSEGVRKVVRHSVHLEEGARQELAGRMQTDHNILAGHLPYFTIAQNVAVDKHPVAKRRRAVVIDQRYVDFDDTGIFDTSNHGYIFPEVVEPLVRKYPGIDDALLDLMDGTRAVAREEGKVPDFWGHENLVVTREATPELIIIDGQPVDNSIGHIDWTMASFEALERTLSQIR